MNLVLTRGREAGRNTENLENVICTCPLNGFNEGGRPHSERGVHFMGPGKRASLLNGSELSRYFSNPLERNP